MGSVVINKVNVVEVVSEVVWNFRFEGKKNVRSSTKRDRGKWERGWMEQKNVPRFRKSSTQTYSSSTESEEKRRGWD